MNFVYKLLIISLMTLFCSIGFAENMRGDTNPDKNGDGITDAQYCSECFKNQVAAQLNACTTPACRTRIEAILENENAKTKSSDDDTTE